MPREFNGQYEYNENGINEIISEKGDMFLALREVRWKAGNDFKLDLRHYKSDEYGDKTLKGCAFNDDEADELTKVLIAGGLGDDVELANAIVEHRPNLCRELESIFGENADMSEVDARENRLFSRVNDDEMDDVQESGSLDDYYDPRAMIS